MLYKVEKNNKISYLFGTMHSASEEAYTFVNIAKKALLQCDTFAAEVNFETLDIATLSQHFLLKDGLQLHELYGPKKWKKMKKIFLKAYGVNIDRMQHMIPFLIENNINTSNTKSVYPDNLDTFLYKYALQHGKTIAGLESMEDQIDTLNSLDLNMQMQSLYKFSQNPSRSRQRSEKIINAYAQFDKKTIKELTHKSLGKFRHILMRDRNINMVASMIKLMENHTVFAAVGAGHLFGKNGMIHLLKEAGHEVKYE